MGGIVGPVQPKTHAALAAMKAARPKRSVVVVTPRTVRGRLWSTVSPRALLMEQLKALSDDRPAPDILD